MLTEELSHYIVEQKAIASAQLNRYLVADIYLPKNIANTKTLSLLLINDGQNLEEINFAQMVNQLAGAAEIGPLVVVGLHANKDRKKEYGTAGIPDFEGRGNKAHAYELFILEELLPYIHINYGIEKFRCMAIAGFSLGGLSALDTMWNYPHVFSLAGVFSGSLWWRKKDLDAGYDEEKDRIMHQLIKEGKYKPGLRFYFTTGSLDETADRNNNGIIDSIDDTLALVEELEKLGYKKDRDIKYINYEDGRHDMETWARAMPLFLLWGWGKNA